MTLFQQWDLINYIANKDYEGNIIEPDKFNELIKVVNIDLFKVKMGLPEDYQPGSPLSRQSLDLTQRLTDETRFLKERESTQTVAAGIVAYPSDYFGDSSIRYNYQRTVDGASVTLPKPVEELTESEYSDRAGNWTKKPSEKDPVCVIRNDGIYIYPADIASVDFNYIRYPVAPEFDYDVETGYITDGGASVQYEWGEHLHMDLTRMILGYIGISLREQQLQQYAEQHKVAGV